MADKLMPFMLIDDRDLEPPYGLTHGRVTDHHKARRRRALKEALERVIEMANASGGTAASTASGGTATSRKAKKQTGAPAPEPQPFPNAAAPAGARRKRRGLRLGAAAAPMAPTPATSNGPELPKRLK